MLGAFGIGRITLLSYLAICFKLSVTSRTFLKTVLPVLKSLIVYNYHCQFFSTRGPDELNSQETQSEHGIETFLRISLYVNQK